MGFGLTLIIFVISYLFSSIRIINEYEKAVIFRLGRVQEKAKGPGIFFVFFPFDKMHKISLRTITLDVPPQDVITKDNVSMMVNAVVYFRVFDPIKAVIEVEDYLFATSQMSQTTLRSIAGEMELDEILAQRETINQQLQKILDKQTDPWGVKVSAVEIKHVDLPQEMKRAMARQAEAEREKRAKVISAEGELQASEKLQQAAHTLAKEPTTLQLRYLQTLTEISNEQNSVTIFPLPMEILRFFQERK